MFEDMKSRFSKKISDFKNKGIRLVKNDIYEFNLRLRTAEDIKINIDKKKKERH